MELKYVVVMVLLSGIVSAQIDSAELSAQTYTISDDIIFTVNITNPGAVTKNYSITCSFVPVGKIYGMYPLLEEIELGPGATDSVIFEMYVSSTLPAGDWLCLLLYDGNVSAAGPAGDLAAAGRFHPRNQAGQEYINLSEPHN